MKSNHRQALQGDEGECVCVWVCWKLCVQNVNKSRRKRRTMSGRSGQHMNSTTRASICDPTATAIYDCRGRSPSSMRLVIEANWPRWTTRSSFPCRDSKERRNYANVSDDIKEKGAQLCLEYFHFVVPQEVLYLFYFNNRVWAESICGS